MTKPIIRPNLQNKRPKSLQDSISRIFRIAMFESGINSIKELAIETGIAYDRLWREITGKNDWFLWDLYLCCEVLSLSESQRASLLSPGFKR